MNNFKGKNQQENLIAIFLSQINIDEHVSTKINTFRIYKGGLGEASPPRSRRKLKKKKSNKMEAFLIFFFSFWQGSLNPQIMSLLPSSPKIINSDPQLPENK